MWLDITVCCDTISSGSQSGFVSRLRCEALKGGLALMSNEKEKKRPLDAEKLSGSQMEGIAGGADDAGSGSESDGEKVRLNSAYVDVSGND